MRNYHILYHLFNMMTIINLAILTIPKSSATSCGEDKFAHTSDTDTQEGKKRMAHLVSDRCLIP